MELSDVNKLKELEDENRRLKSMFADLSLEHPILKDIVKKSSKPAIRRQLVDHARQAHGASLRMACRAVGISDSVYRYTPQPPIGTMR